jgi:Zn-finger domain-containing protein
MVAEAARNDGRLARRPLENVESEIQAHRMLLTHLKDKIQRYSTAIEVSVRNITENFLLIHNIIHTCHVAVLCILSASDISCDKYEDGDIITADYS